MRLPAAIAMLIAMSVVLSACGSQGISVPKTSPYYRGAVIFRDHCSGCHTLATVGAEGSATSIKNRLKTNGPNFNYRKENYEQVMYAIHNGGFSGAIMPENVVLGDRSARSRQIPGEVLGAAGTEDAVGGNSASPRSSAEAPAPMRGRTAE